MVRSSSHLGNELIEPLRRSNVAGPYVGDTIGQHAERLPPCEALGGAELDSTGLPAREHAIPDERNRAKLQV
jgi:hypothetical protein